MVFLYPYYVSCLSEVEGALEGPHGGGGAGVIPPVHRRFGDGGVVGGDPVQIGLHLGHGGAGGALGEGVAGEGGLDVGDLVGLDDLDVVAVIPFQDVEGGIAVVGQGDGAPLGKPRAGGGGAVAEGGEKRFPEAHAADILVEHPVHDLGDVVGDGLALFEILVISGRISNIEGVAAGAVPFGIDPVQGQGDDAEDVGLQRGLGPGGVDLAGGDVFHIRGKVHRDVPGGGVGGHPQVHCDFGRDEDVLQGAGRRRALLRGLGLNPFEVVVRHLDPLRGGAVGVDAVQHDRLGGADGIEHLRPVDDLGDEAVRRHRDGIFGIGRPARLQAGGFVRCLERDRLGLAVFVGDQAVERLPGGVGDGHLRPRHRQRPVPRLHIDF